LQHNSVVITLTMGAPRTGKKCVLALRTLVTLVTLLVMLMNW